MYLSEIEKYVNDHKYHCERKTRTDHDQKIISDQFIVYQDFDNKVVATIDLTIQGQLTLDHMIQRSVAGKLLKFTQTPIEDRFDDHTVKINLNHEDLRSFRDLDLTLYHPEKNAVELTLNPIEKHALKQIKTEMKMPNHVLNIDQLIEYIGGEGYTMETFADDDVYEFYNPFDEVIAQVNMRNQHQYVFNDRDTPNHIKNAIIKFAHTNPDARDAVLHFEPKLSPAEVEKISKINLNLPQDQIVLTTLQAKALRHLKKQINQILFKEHHANLDQDLRDSNQADN